MSDYIDQTYQVNIIPDIKITDIVHVSQYDVGKRRLRFILYAGNAKYALSDDEIVSIRGAKSDGTIYEYECEKEDENTVNVVVTSQMTAVAGFHSAELRIYEGSTLTGSANLKIKVETSPFQESYVPSATDLPLIEQTEQNAIASKLYASQALNSANAASNSASAAASSQETAAGNASASATNANNASKSAEAAAASATAAATSEKNAMSATPDGYSTLVSTFNALGLYVDTDGYTCQAIEGEEQD